MTDSERPEGALSDEELLERGAQETPGTSTRTINPLERRFVDFYLGPAQGNAGAAARMVGWAAPTGAQILERPWVQEEIARQVELAKSRTGSLQLDKERLLLELDNAMLEAKTAFSKEVTVYGTCPNPECGRRVPVTVKAGPKEIASLAIAVSRAVEVAARIVGALAPTKVEHTGKTPVQDTYATLVRMVRENVQAIAPAQKADMIDAARRDRADIDELLALLGDRPEPAH